jgi:hypothetical protein
MSIFCSSLELMIEALSPGVLFENLLLRLRANLGLLMVEKAKKKKKGSDANPMCFILNGIPLPCPSNCCSSDNAMIVVFLLFEGQVVSGPRCSPSNRENVVPLEVLVDFQASSVGSVSRFDDRSPIVRSTVDY